MVVCSESDYCVRYKSEYYFIIMYIYQIYNHLLCTNIPGCNQNARLRNNLPQFDRVTLQKSCKILAGAPLEGWNRNRNVVTSRIDCELT